MKPLSRNSQTRLQSETTVSRTPTANRACVRPPRAGTGAAQLCSGAPARLLAPGSSGSSLFLSSAHVPNPILWFALSSLLFPFSPWPRATPMERCSFLGVQTMGCLLPGWFSSPSLGDCCHWFLFGFCRRTPNTSVIFLFPGLC